MAVKRNDTVSKPTHHFSLSVGTLIPVSHSHHSPFLIEILARQRTAAGIDSSFTVAFDLDREPYGAPTERM